MKHCAADPCDRWRKTRSPWRSRPGSKHRPSHARDSASSPFRSRHRPASPHSTLRVSPASAICSRRRSRLPRRVSAFSRARRLAGRSVMLSKSDARFTYSWRYSWRARNAGSFQLFSSSPSSACVRSYRFTCSLFRASIAMNYTKSACSRLLSRRSNAAPRPSVICSNNVGCSIVITSPFVEFKHGPERHNDLSACDGQAQQIIKGDPGTTATTACAVRW